MRVQTDNRSRRRRAPGEIRCLVVTNAYPSEGRLYRNGFVHSRVLGYRKLGLDVEVFWHHPPVADPYTYDFEDVSVTVGDSKALEDYVRDNHYDCYLIHFPEPQRVEPLTNVDAETPIIAWIHGFEAESWHRRWFNVELTHRGISQFLNKREDYYIPQNRFLNNLVISQRKNLYFVNVSEWFQRIVVEPDIGADFTNNVVIPNYIDTNEFAYRKKAPEDRFKILSLRPFASHKYANDLTVEAIKILSKRPYFKQLEFTIAGEGPLFDETTASIKSFKNVKLMNRFFTSAEISELHADHGVFLAPTRFDSQGVSMCEAMSSGLAVISNNTAAIPEFVDHRKSGLLVEPESAVGLADAIEQLVFDEELFQSISSQASISIGERAGFEASIGKEVELILKAVSNVK